MAGQELVFLFPLRKGVCIVGVTELDGVTEGTIVPCDSTLSYQIHACESAVGGF